LNQITQVSAGRKVCANAIERGEVIHIDYERFYEGRWKVLWGKVKHPKDVVSTMNLSRSKREYGCSSRHTLSTVGRPILTVLMMVSAERAPLMIAIDVMYTTAMTGV
jgi:hypothetical protein